MSSSLKMMERGYSHSLPADSSVSSFFPLLAYYSDLVDLSEPFASFFFSHQGQVLKEGFQSFAFQFFQAFPGQIKNLLMQLQDCQSNSTSRVLNTHIHKAQPLYLV